MSLPPPYSVVLDTHPIRSASRELYLLRLRAETFRVELELESQLELQGLATLPIEWTDYLEHQRQLILDKIRWMESREGDSLLRWTSLVMRILHTLYLLYGVIMDPPACPSDQKKVFTPPFTQKTRVSRLLH
jgi:hypothetical protein